VTPNEGVVDRVIRVAVGVVLLYLAVTGVATGAWAWLAWIAGVLALVTGATGFCLIYRLFGISTRPEPGKQG